MNTPTKGLAWSGLDFHFKVLHPSLAVSSPLGSSISEAPGQGWGGGSTGRISDLGPYACRQEKGFKTTQVRCHMLGGLAISLSVWAKRFGEPGLFPAAGPWSTRLPRRIPRSSTASLRELSTPRNPKSYTRSPEPKKVYLKVQGFECTIWGFYATLVHTVAEQGLKFLNSLPTRTPNPQRP